MTIYSLRPATVEDSEVVYRLHRASLGPYVEEVYGPWDDEAQRHRHDLWLDAARPDVIETGDGVIGVVHFVVTDDHAELGRISIHPDHQNRGLGTAVLTALLKRADDLGLPVQLEVFDINPARQLYERLGFREVRRRAARSRWCGRCSPSDDPTTAGRRPPLRESGGDRRRVSHLRPWFP